MKKFLVILFLLCLILGGAGLFWFWMTHDPGAQSRFILDRAESDSQEPERASATGPGDPVDHASPAITDQEPGSTASIPPADPPPFPLPAQLRKQTFTYPANYWNGIRMEVLLDLRPGNASSVELSDRAVLREPRLNLAFSEPAAARQSAQLLPLNEQFEKVLPHFSQLLATAEVSPYFADLYAAKKERNRDNMPRLDRVLSRHNYYDCETILSLQHPETKRRALFIQSEMDVLTDGSDGDRMPEIAGESPTFQPFTSYAWPKRGNRPNPFLAKVQSEQKSLRAELTQSPTSSRRDAINARLNTLKLYENDMKARSFLVGEIDPFIALPLSMIRGRDTAHKPDFGDYAVVIHGDKIYPAIVGDAGPGFKAGEASMLISREINPNTTIFSRPVSELVVTYLVFPGTAEKPFGPPDYVGIRKRCEELLADLGGHDGTLHKWIEEIGTAIAQTTRPSGAPAAAPLFSAAPVDNTAAENAIRQATPRAKSSI